MSDGQIHSAEVWAWLDNDLFILFGGRTVAPGLYEGFYPDPESGERVDDQSRRYEVAIPDSELPILRELLVQACDWFEQKCIYLSVAGVVEFVQRRQK